MVLLAVEPPPPRGKGDGPGSGSAAGMKKENPQQSRAELGVVLELV